MNEKIVSALIGLAGAYSSNGKTPNTDAIVTNALLHCYSDNDEVAIVNDIVHDKYTLSPNCETCPTPCGNTSDYDMTKFHSNTELISLKEELLFETVALAKRISARGKHVLPEDIYRALCFFSYELDEASYRKQINTLKQMEV